MSSRKSKSVQMALACLFVASAAMAQRGEKPRESDPARETPHQREVREEYLRYGRELTPKERMEHEQHRMELLRLGITEKQYQSLQRLGELNTEYKKRAYEHLFADPEIADLARKVSCVPCPYANPYSASTLRNILRRTDGAVEAFLGAYNSGPAGVGMREVFGRALGAGAPIPAALRTESFDSWVTTLGLQADVLESLWNDAAAARESDSTLTWDRALHRAALRYRRSKQLNADDPALEELRTDALLRRLRETGCL